MILGTAAYMAPEQARGKEAAFGVVLYELLTARGSCMFPMSGCSPGDLISPTPLRLQELRERMLLFSARTGSGLVSTLERV